MQADVHPSYSWRLVSTSRIQKEEFRFFENYFESKKELSSFPFTIFTDHIPDKSELEEILQTKNIYQEKLKPLILFLKKKQANDLSDCWNLLSMGVDDVITGFPVVAGHAQ